MAAPNNNINVIRHPSPPISPRVHRPRVTRRNQQFIRIRMILLLHARNCQEHGDARCGLRYCKEFRNVLKHMPFCTRERHCQRKSCSSSRLIIKHWNQCQRCFLCRSVKQSMRELPGNDDQNNAAPPQVYGGAQQANQAQAGQLNVPGNQGIQGAQAAQRPLGNGGLAPGNVGAQQRVDGARPQHQALRQDIRQNQIVQRPYEPLTPPPSRHNVGHPGVQGFYQHNAPNQMQNHPVFYAHPNHQPQYYPQNYGAGGLMHQLYYASQFANRAQRMVAPVYPNHYGYYYQTS